MHPGIAPPSASPFDFRDCGNTRGWSPAGRHEVDQRPTALQVVRATPKSVDPDGIAQLEHAAAVNALDHRFKVGEKRVGEDVFRQMIASGRSPVS